VDICGGTVVQAGNCKETICNKWLNGLVFKIGSVLSSSARALAGHEMPAGIQELLEVVSSIHDSIRSPLERADELNAQLASHGRVLAGSSVNTYGTGGYPAYENGCADPGMDCPKVFPVVAVVIAVVVVVVISVVAVVVIRRRRAGKSAFSSGEYA
jgi:hypothetical protein